MKKTLYFALIFLFSTSLFSQELQKKSGLSLKLQGGLSASFNFGTDLNLFGVQPAIQFRTAKNHLHQLAVLNMSIGRGWSRIGDNNNFNLSLAYEYAFPISLFSNNEYLRAYLGMGIESAVYSYSFDPDLTNVFVRAKTAFFNRIYLLHMIKRSINELILLEFVLHIYWGENQGVRV
ncbi:MAG: hypothetical protein AAFR87_29215, partial [Bacteroidota bacterium]